MFYVEWKKKEIKLFFVCVFKMCVCVSCFIWLIWIWDKVSVKKKKMNTLIYTKHNLWPSRFSKLSSQFTKNLKRLKRQREKNSTLSHLSNRTISTCFNLSGMSVVRVYVNTKTNYIFNHCLLIWEAKSIIIYYLILFWRLSNMWADATMVP